MQQSHIIMRVGSLFEIFYAKDIDDMGIWEKIIFWNDCHDRMVESIVMDSTWMGDYIRDSLHFSYMSPLFLLEKSVRHFPVSR